MIMQDTQELLHELITDREYWYAMTEQDLEEEYNNIPEEDDESRYS